MGSVVTFTPHLPEAMPQAISKKLSKVLPTSQPSKKDFVTASAEWLMLSLHRFTDVQ